MEKLQITYKCRRCRERVRDAIGSEKGIESALIKIVVSGEDDQSGLKIHGIHHCLDGGIGITDLIGAHRKWN